MRLCFSVALWNGKDPILKERLFGVSPTEGNHGEDVKECYFYLDATPTSSYAKMLYRSRRRHFRTKDLVQTNKSKSRAEPEYKLIDTGVFDGNRYFDVFVEYAKASPEDILIRITVTNRGPEAGVLYVLPTSLVPEHLVATLRRSGSAIDGDAIPRMGRQSWRTMRTREALFALRVGDDCCVHE